MSIRAELAPAPASVGSAASVAAAPGPRKSCHGWSTPSSNPPFVSCSGPVAMGNDSVGLPDGAGVPVGVGVAVGVGAGVLVGIGVGVGDGGAEDGAGVGGSASASSAFCS